MIGEVNSKMVEINNCKDVEVLRNKFKDEEFKPLNITITIVADSELDYVHLSALLATFGKMESLLISENKKEATLKFENISSAVRVN